jgi:hypothetical protein
VIVGCLALNSSFEPLTMVPLRRALRLVIDGKAEIVEADHDALVRSERLAYPRPVVIRLAKFIHVPRRFRRQVTNTFLFARDAYTCQYCERKSNQLRPRESTSSPPAVAATPARRLISPTNAACTSRIRRRNRTSSICRGPYAG